MMQTKVHLEYMYNWLSSIARFVKVVLQILTLFITLCCFPLCFDMLFELFQMQDTKFLKLTPKQV